MGLRLTHITQQQPDFDRYDRESDTSTPPYSEVLFCTPQYSKVLWSNSGVFLSTPEKLLITPKYSKYSKVLRSTPKYSWST
eukprot:scaffold8113_cov85-Skeletonema_dohrnii-CCMP3373.AAC.3